MISEPLVGSFTHPDSIKKYNIFSAFMMYLLKTNKQFVFISNYRNIEYTLLNTTYYIYYHICKHDTFSFPT